MLVGVYSNLPWIIAAWYALTTAVGAWLLRSAAAAGFGETLRELFELSLFQPHFWDRLWHAACGRCSGRTSSDRSSAPAVLAVVAYWLALGFLEARHRLHLERLHLEKLRLDKLRRRRKD